MKNSIFCDVACGFSYPEDGGDTFLLLIMGHSNTIEYYLFHTLLESSSFWSVPRYSTLLYYNYYLLEHYPLSCFFYLKTFWRLDYVSILRQKPEPWPHVCEVL
jgi:hypothetical protein